MAQPRGHALVLVWNPGWADDVATALRGLGFETRVAFEYGEVATVLGEHPPRFDVIYLGARALTLAQWPQLEPLLAGARVLLRPALGQKPAAVGGWLKATRAVDVDTDATTSSIAGWLTAALSDEPDEQRRRADTLARHLAAAEADAPGAAAAKQEKNESRLPLHELAALPRARFAHAVFVRFAGDTTGPLASPERELRGAWLALHEIEAHGLAEWFAFPHCDAPGAVEHLRAVGLASAARTLSSAITALGGWVKDSGKREDRANGASPQTRRRWEQLQKKLTLAPAHLQALQKYCARAAKEKTEKRTARRRRVTR